MSLKLKAAEFEELMCNANRLAPNTKQTVGVGWDAMDPTTGIKFEFKLDLMQRTTGNFYVETEQTFDNWATWQASGVGLKQADYYIYSNGIEIFTFEKSAILNALPGLSTRTTKQFANGNRPDSFSKGHLLKIADARKLALKVESIDDVKSRIGSAS